MKPRSNNDVTCYALYIFPFYACKIDNRDDFQMHHSKRCAGTWRRSWGYRECKGEALMYQLYIHGNGNTCGLPPTTLLYQFLNLM